MEQYKKMDGAVYGKYLPVSSQNCCMPVVETVACKYVFNKVLCNYRPVPIQHARSKFPRRKRNTHQAELEPDEQRAESRLPRLRTTPFLKALRGRGGRGVRSRFVAGAFCLHSLAV